MWLGFFAWYRGLALGGTVRVSQVQLVQPFLAMLFAVPVLGERLDAGDGRVRARRRRHRVRRPRRCRSARRRRSARAVARNSATWRRASSRGPDEPQPSPWRLAARTARMNPSAIREILKLTELPGHHLARRRPAVGRHLSGRGDARGDDARAARDAARGAAVRGERRLRAAARVGRRRDGASRPGASMPAQVLITTGSQQGLDLVGKVLIDAGSQVAVESPTYLGALQAFVPYEPEFVTVACDDEGPLPDAFAATAEGRALPLRAAQLPEPERPLDRRRAARRDRAGPPRRSACRSSRTTRTASSGSTPPPAAPIAAHWREGTVYLGSFSKVLAPGPAPRLRDRAAGDLRQAGRRPSRPPTCTRRASTSASSTR